MCKDKEEGKARTIYISSLNKGYIQSHLIPRWIPLNHSNLYKYFLILYKSLQTPLQKNIIGMKTPELQMQEVKNKTISAAPL